MSATALRFDEYQFHRPSLPVSPETGIAWSDYARMGLEEHKLFSRSRDRRRDWRWVFDTERLRATVLSHCERYLNLRPDPTAPQAQRLATIQARIPVVRAAKVRTLDDLCRRFVGETDPAAKAKLRGQVRSLDASIRLLDRGLLASILELVWLWRMGWNSAEISTHLQVLSGPGVRQVVHRLSRAAMRKQTLKSAPRPRPRSCVVCGKEFTTPYRALCCGKGCARVRKTASQKAGRRLREG